MKNSKQRLKQIIAMTLALSMTLVCGSGVSVSAITDIRQADKAALGMYDDVSYDFYQNNEAEILTHEEVEKDSDNDGLNDGFEQIFKTDPYKADTDDDGLNDYLEVILGLDPTRKDSDNDGIEDILEDSDNDGLNNLNEIKYGTDPSKKDTDGDGLTDGEEVYKYNTSPLEEDSDNDSLIDGDEIKLGLNPGAAYSDGVTIDSQRKVQQTLNSDRIMPQLLEKTSLFIPSLSGEAAGIMDKNIIIEDYDENSISEMPGILGEAIEIKCAHDFDGKLTLAFDCTNFLENNDDSVFDQLVICKYDGSNFVPLNTIKDKENNSLYTEEADYGVYFVLDNEKFLSSLNKLPKGIEVYSSSSCLSDGNTEESEENVDADDEKNTVLLNDYKSASLDAPVSNDIDSDNDGLSDEEELGNVETRDLTEFKNLLLEQKGLSDEELESEESEEVEVYTYASNPTETDTDFDGLDDSQDSAPKDNKFSASLKTDFATSDISYTMDYRNFFKGNSSYNRNISVISSLYSTNAYSGSTINGLSITQFMAYHGLKDIKTYNLKSSYSDSDLSLAYIGHRKVTYNGVTKEIIAVIVRGTASSQEWESNFDIGSTALKSNYSDWKITTNHKGFDAASTRLLKCLNQYEAQGYLDSSAKKAYWLTGHSRGAAIANIMGARLINSSKEVYDYTFAAPNTTTSSTAANYTGIYNIINKDDFVPCLPMKVWSFKHYGKDYTVSIADNYEKEWETLTGISDYNCDTIGMDDTITKLGAIMNTRNDAYVFSCKCHGDGSSDNISIKNYGTSKSSREAAIAKIPANALPYCAITRYNGGAFYGWDFKVCQKPEYFMQVLAAFMAGKINAYRFVVELNIASRYESAKTAIIRSGIGGLAHPHYPESYYVLSKHI